MGEQHQVYKCDECGMIVEVVQAGQCDLCCGSDAMALQEAKTADTAAEKHVPFIEKIDGGYKVRIGESAAHPMEEDHYIQWIELTCGRMVAKVFLAPGDAPEATFRADDCSETCGRPTAREYCNKHGLWKG